MKYKKITITMKDDYFAFWEEGEWDDFYYDKNGRFFIVKKQDVFVGFYNLDCVKTIVIE